MAISISSTHVITIPQSDLTFLSGTIWQLDTNWFRLQLKSWEDSEQGIVHPKTHNHNTAITIAGVTYARAIEILSPYTIQFEDLGHPGYTVLLTGSNNNIFAEGIIVTNHNSVLGQNSAGLIQVTSGSGLSSEQSTQLAEIHKLLGLKVGIPVEITKTGQVIGDIELEFTGDGENDLTITRV